MGAIPQAAWLGVLLAAPGLPLFGVAWWFAARGTGRPRLMHLTFPVVCLALMVISCVLIAPRTRPGEEPGPGDGIALILPVMSAGVTVLAYIVAGLCSVVMGGLSGGLAQPVIAPQLDRIV